MTERGPTEAMSSRTWVRTAAWFLLILTVAASLRFYNIQHAGVFAMDEARYLLDADAKRIEMQHLLEIARLKFAERAGGPEFRLADYLPQMHADLAEHGVFFPKTLFYYLAGAMMLCTGFVTWSGAAIQALFGVLSVAMLFFLVRRVHSTRAALAAAAILALSAFHLYYSRTAYTQCLPGFFVLAALAAHARWGTGQGGVAWLFVAGLALGAGLWGAYQTLALVPALACTHLYVSALAPDFWARVRRVFAAAFVGLGAAAALLVAEAPTYPLILLFRAFGMEYPHATYLELNVPRWTYHTQLPTHWGGLLVFPYYLSRFEGIATMAAMLLVAALGIGACWPRRGERAGVVSLLRHPAVPYLAIPLALPFLVLAVKTVLVIRSYVHIVPFVAGVLGVAVAAAWNTQRRSVRVVLALALLIAAVSSVRQGGDTLRIRSGYDPAQSAFLVDMERRGAALVPGPQSLIPACYMTAAGLEPYGTAMPDGRLRPQFLVCDLQELSVGPYPDQFGLIPAGANPILSYEQRITRPLVESEGIPAFGYETPLWSLRRAYGVDLDRAAKVLVYDLTDVPTHAPRISPDIPTEITKNIPR